MKIDISRDCKYYKCEKCGAEIRMQYGKTVETPDGTIDDLIYEQKKSQVIKSASDENSVKKSNSHDPFTHKGCGGKYIESKE